MGRAPCCDKANVKKGPWSPEEDEKLKQYMEKYGTGGNWIALPQKAGLRRCGKSCRLRWLNYLRPNIKHGEFSDAEDRIICTLFANIGSRWSIIAGQLPGRTDNDIKNYWNTKLKKKLMGLMVPTSQKRPPSPTTYPSISLLQTSSPALSSSPYTCSSNNNYYTTLSRPFTGYETISIPSNLMNTTCSPDVGPMQDCQVIKDSFLMFGGGEASCSSSDGSCNNQISHVKKVEFHEYGVSAGDQEMGLQSYLYNGVDENQKLMTSNGYCEKSNGFYDETPLDYSLEDIKQLITTNVCHNVDLFVDENKTVEKIMYY